MLTTLAASAVFGAGDRAATAALYAQKFSGARPAHVPGLRCQRGPGPRM